MVFHDNRTTIMIGHSIPLYLIIRIRHRFISPLLDRWKYFKSIKPGDTYKLSPWRHSGASHAHV